MGLSRARQVPGPSSTASSAGAHHSIEVLDFTVPAAPDRRRALDFSEDNCSKKEERLAPLNFLSALAHAEIASARFPEGRRTSAIPAVRCGQIFRSSRLTLNKSQ